MILESLSRKKTINITDIGLFNCLQSEIVIATIAINILGLVLPIVTLQLYDRIIPNEALQTLNILVIALLTTSVLDVILRICRSLLMAHLGNHYEKNSTQALLDVIMHSDLSEFESKRNTDYLEKIKAIEQVKEIHFGQNILSLLDLPFIVLFFALIWLFAGSLVLIPVLMFVTFALISIYFSNQLIKVLMDRDRVFEQRHNFLLEILQGIQTLKPLAMEDQMLRRYERLQARSAQIIYKLTYINNIIQSVSVTLPQMTMIAFVGVGGYFAASGSITVGALAAGSTLAGRILQPASRAFNFWMQWKIAQVAEAKVKDLFHLKQEADNKSQNKADEINGRISLQNIYYEIPESHNLLLNNINLNIQENEFVAICGDNGCGKTTLTKILMGLVQPTSGEIKYDDKSIAEFNKTHLRQQVAFVPQRGVLFNGSMLENLTAFRQGDITKQALYYVKLLGLDDVIMRMRDGLATEIDNSLIDNIPEGLRQRIVMVRAILGDVKVIIFDDANIGYDKNNTNKLVDFFKSIKGEKTIILVSNQDDLLNLSDRCFRLHEGKLIALHSKHKKHTRVTSSGQRIQGGAST